MQTNHRIRIIKRAERELRREEAHAAKQSANATQRERKTPRHEVMTITEWITELRQKKIAAAAAARSFEGLFTEAA